VSHSLTHSDTLDSDRSWTQWGHRSLGATNTKQLLLRQLNVTRAMRASPAPAYMTHAHSLRTSVRQWCACVRIPSIDCHCAMVACLV